MLRTLLLTVAIVAEGFAVTPSVASQVAPEAICADLATVAATIAEARTQSLGSVVVPSAAATWWRAQLRIRRDAIDAVNAPIRMAQWVAAVGVAVAIVMLILRNWASVAAADPAIGWGLLLPLAVAAATISIATPLALCFVMSSD